MLSTNIHTEQIGNRSASEIDRGHEQRSNIKSEPVSFKFVIHSDYIVSGNGGHKNFDGFKLWA